MFQFKDIILHEIHTISEKSLLGKVCHVMLHATLMAVGFKVTNVKHSKISFSLYILFLH